MRNSVCAERTLTPVLSRQSASDTGLCLHQPLDSLVRVSRPVLHRPGQGELIQAGGASSVSIKADTSATVASLYLGEVSLEPGYPGRPPHIHERLDDMFYVLEGPSRSVLRTERRSSLRDLLPASHP